MNKFCIFFFFGVIIKLRGERECVWMWMCVCVCVFGNNKRSTYDQVSHSGMSNRGIYTTLVV